MNFRTKIALVFTAVMASVLLMLSSFVYFLALRHVHSNFFTRLRVRASIAAEMRYSETHGTLIGEIRNRHLQRLSRETELYLTRDSTLTEALPMKLPGVPMSFVREALQHESSEYYSGFAHYSAMCYSSGKGEEVVIAMAYDEEGEDQMDYLFNVLLVGFSVSCILVFGIGRLLARQFLKPISLINAKVNTITASDLGERLPQRTDEDEIAELTRTFNTMLDRLETAFELQSNFVGNASHELRTPLTAILGESEVILASPRSNTEYIASIRSMRRQAEKLDDLTESLLKLSQISFDGKKQAIEQVMVEELLMSIKISVDQRMPHNHLRILLQPPGEDGEPFTLMCVRIWMELAVTNIIQNSIKYSDNKEVLVTLSGDRDGFMVRISDEGIGIPRLDLPHILEPFFRASNTGKYSGYGIGLPLASKIIRLHGGVIDVISREGSGTQVSLKFSTR